jgi:hypothetical protein
VTVSRGFGGRTDVTRGGTTGVLGGRFRADVTPWGDIVPWDGSPVLAWHVAADDRWHLPATEVAVRQLRIAGAPVFETRLRVPGGDAVQRVWSVADGGGRTMVEVVNDSPLPIAVAFTRDDLLTVRRPAGVPAEGIALPASTIVLPVGHRAAVVVALDHGGAGRGPLPAGSAAAEATARGWVARAERASRVEVPDASTAERLVIARSDVLLAGPPDVTDDPVGALLALAELVRLGEPVDALDPLDHVAVAVHAIARRPGWDVDAALDAAAVVLAHAGEHRAVADLARIVTDRTPPSPPDPAASGIRAVAAVERVVLCRGDLFPGGIPAAWRGIDLEAHGLPAGPASTLSFALRWHGANAAVLWEVDGPAVELSAPAVDPAWRTSRPCGEALLRLSGGRTPPTGG